MNFKTTLVLLAVLVAAGVALFLTKSSPKDETTTADKTPAKLLDFSTVSVDRLTITPADGKTTVLKRDGINWQLTEPVVGPADTTLPGEILTDLSSMTSSGNVSVSGADAAATGLTPPRFQLILDTKEGKTIKLAVGDRSGTGGQLYVQREGQSQADLVQADVYDLLDKPASAFRRTKLLDVQTPSIDTMTIERNNEPAIVLDRKGAGSSTGSSTASSSGLWTIEKPTTMPADTAAVTDLLSALSNLQASNFVNETNTDPRRYGLANPAVRVTFGTTQPSTTVDFGMLDVMKQNAYVSTSTMPGVVQVTASTLDTFKKSPLDLRDKNVVSIDPATIAGITIQTILPATTQPTTRQASDQKVVLQHRTAPTSTSLPATTTATTAPQPKPIAHWSVASATQPTAVDVKVSTLLAAFHPLKVQKYLPAPTTMPATADHYRLKLESEPPMTANYKIELTDPGNSQPVLGRYNDLLFELDRTVLDPIKADFSKADAPQSPSAAPSPAPGFPGGLPPG